MRLFFPLSTETGWAVVYATHRDELMPVMECRSFEAALAEAERMTAQSVRESLGLASFEQRGNRYLRRWGHA